MATCGCPNSVWDCVLATLFTIYVIIGTLTTIAKLIKLPHFYLPSELFGSDNIAYNHDYCTEK